MHDLDVLVSTLRHLQTYKFHLKWATRRFSCGTNLNGFPTGHEVRNYVQKNWNQNMYGDRVLAGPQSSPDYLTEDDVLLLYSQQYQVSHNASRLGIRLNPLNPEGNNNKFTWARKDGGEGGSHPSNLIDNPYSFGSVNFTGDY